MNERPIAALAPEQSPGIEREYADGLLTLRLCRAPLNVLDIALLLELDAQLAAAAADPAVRVLLITARGERWFSAGVNVADHTAERIQMLLPLFHSLIRRLYHFPVPTIAVLNGSALGGGLELALACDLRLAVAEAQLGQPEIRLGVFAPVAAILLPRLLPPGLAHEMLLGGRLLTAAEALQFGLLNRVLRRDESAAGVADFLAPYLQLSRAAQVHNKRALRETAGPPFDVALELLERRYLDGLMATHDAHEGIAAFMEKRAPQWRHE